MKKCKYCNVTVDTEKDFCPLCFNSLSNKNDDLIGYYSPRLENSKVVKSSTFLFRLFMFLTLVALTGCGVINFLVTPQTQWFWTVLFGLLYVWILVYHTILSKDNIFNKVVLQIITILLLLFFAEQLSVTKWVLPYVFPAISLTVDLALVLILFISGKRGAYALWFAIIIALLSITSLILLLLSVDKFWLLNLINLIVSGLTFLGIILFGIDAIKSEAAKKLHL